MTTDEMIAVLKDGRINAYDSATIIAKLQAADKLRIYAEEVSDLIPFTNCDLPEVVQELNQAIHNYDNAGKGE